MECREELRLQGMSYPRSCELCGPQACKRSSFARVKELESRIADLEAEKAERMNWQPIETAPKDGTNVLLYREAGNMFIVGYFDHAHGWVDGECIASVARPDYWCKLEPPK